MAQPLVMGDKIQGQCAIHQIPNPASGAPQPVAARCRSPRRCSTGLEPTVTIGGKAVAVMGSSGYNTPPHVGLHPADPFMVPTTQEGMVAERQPDGDGRRQADRDVDARRWRCARRCPGKPVPTVTDVTVGVRRRA